MKSFLFAILTLISTKSFAHGENILGPHQGFIRMPGAYHTEALVAEKNKLNVYLLDIEWKNPIIKKSSVEVSHSQNKKLKIKCTEIENLYFQCNFPATIDLNAKGKIVVRSTREGQTGNLVSYDLPLKLDGEQQVPKNEQMNHEHMNHH